MAAPPGGGVPPGFRFHPTDEELLHFYLRKKVGMEKFELDVIREVDVNKIEPWELQGEVSNPACLNSLCTSRGCSGESHLACRGLCSWFYQEKYILVFKRTASPLIRA